jgi:hypothetical protein
VELIPRAVAARLHAFPLGVMGDDGVLVVALRDPHDREALSELARLCGRKVRPVVAPEAVIDEFIAARYPAAAEPPAVEPPAPEPVAVEPPERTPVEDLPELSVVALPRASALGRPTRPSASNALRWRAIVAMVVVAVVGLIVLVGWRVLRARGADRGVDVGGELFNATHVHMTVTLPAGWRYLPSKDYEQRMGQATERGSLFYRGGSSEIPDEGLVLMLVASGGLVPEQLSEARFRTVLDGIKQASTRSTRGISMAIESCDISFARGAQTGECVGTAALHGTPRNLLLFVWIERGGYVAGAAFLTRAALEDARPGIDQILDTVQVAW